jgi:hypothetical protein
MDYDLALLYNTTEQRIDFGPIEVRGGGMFSRVVTLLAATFTLFGCSSAREGVDFASLSRTVGPPKSGQGRIVILREQGYGGITDHGFPVGLDDESMGELKTGTYLYRDRSAGRHLLSVNEWDFPGVTRREISVASGRTYFFLVRLSERSKALTAGSAFGGLAGLAVTAMVTSGDANPGPVDFVPLDDATGQQAISALRLVK